MYDIIRRQELHTDRDDAPRVKVVTRQGGNPTDIQIEYYVEYNQARKALLTFHNVFEFQWVDEAMEYDDPCPDDFEFDLIEVIDSPIIQRILQNSPYRDRKEGRLGGVLNETDLHHYRVGFDDHGTYDIICTMLDIQLHDAGSPTE